MKAILHVLRNWLRKPSVRQRILNSLSETEWMYPADIMREAEVSPSTFYSSIHFLEEKGYVKLGWEPRPTRNGKKYRRAYQLKPYTGPQILFQSRRWL